MSVARYTGKYVCVSQCKHSGGGGGVMCDAAAGVNWRLPPRNPTCRSSLSSSPSYPPQMCPLALPPSFLFVKGGRGRGLDTALSAVLLSISFPFSPLLPLSDAPPPSLTPCSQYGFRNEGLRYIRAPRHAAVTRDVRWQTDSLWLVESFT